MALVNLIKQASMGAFESSNPVAVLFGTVVKAKPLEVNVEQRFTLTEDFLIVPERLIHFEIYPRHSHEYTDTTPVGQVTRDTEEALPDKIVIRKGLEPGDRVILLRIQGGQKYLLLDRVV